MVAISPWLAAIRPRTLPLGATPVLVGSAFAWNAGIFDAGAAVAALAGALLLQVGTNLANDYYDFRKGADTAERAGPARASATGALPPRAVRNAAFAAFGLAAAVGLYLIWVGGWPVLAIGAAGIVAGLLYTAGPRPLGYMGLGDLLAFLFFGPVAVMGTIYVQAPDEFARPDLWMPGLLMGLQLGAFATAVLVVNNLRDLPTDRKAGKRTMAVVLGEKGSRVEYTIAVLVPFALAVLAYARHMQWRLAIPLLGLPLVVRLLRRVWTQHRDRAELNAALGGTARLATVFALLLCVGLLVPR